MFIGTNWLHYTIFLFFLTIGVMVIVSMFTEKPREDQLQGLTWGSASPEQIAETKGSWNKWDVFHTVVIVSIIAGFYIYFW